MPCPPLTNSNCTSGGSPNLCCSTWNLVSSSGGTCGESAGVPHNSVMTLPVPIANTVPPLIFNEDDDDDDDEDDIVVSIPRRWS